ncbi:hypothetical protein V5799_000072 [Amblyomma americanum]|uniref:Death domain-containing protein n=1 Tax=Amblyomma americanum TaxID=6943 RepID=A0AAQ4D436_AMBAM
MVKLHDRDPSRSQFWAFLFFRMVTVYGRGAYKKFASDLETEALREWQLGNAQLLHFYEANRRQLYEIDYEKVSASLSSIVASCFPGTTWRSFACSLGVPETELQGIEQRAVGDKLMPLQVALQHFYPSLKACSKPCSLGHLADILKERGRLDVLYKILPQVKGKGK